MQLKKHNSKTPPERKPKWLRKGIALLTAIATLATGGVVASTAYASGGGGNETAGEGGTPSRDRDVWWDYKDQALSNPSGRICIVFFVTFQKGEQHGNREGLEGTYLQCMLELDSGMDTADTTGYLNRHHVVSIRRQGHPHLLLRHHQQARNQS